MILLLLLASTALVSAAPFRSEFQSMSFPGPSFERILERIVTEEAEKINRTADEHAAYCAVRLPWQLRFLISQEEELALITEILAFVTDEEIRFHKIDEVLSYFAEKTPHAYSAYMKFREYLGKKMHELNVGQETYDFMSSATNGYKALSEEGKNDVEKMWCVRTAFRVIEATDNIGKIEELLKEYALNR